VRPGAFRSGSSFVDQTIVPYVNFFDPDIPAQAANIASVG
jgi:hypothetical protein